MSALILIVEDNEDILYNIKLMLEVHEYQVLVARNGEEALNLLTSTNKIPDLILSDIMMPKMDGYEFFKEISKYQRWNHIPFIFLTAKSSTEDIRFGKSLGIDDYLVKPFDENDLIAVISGKLARKRRMENLNQQLKEPLNSLGISLEPSLDSDDKQYVILLHVIWDDYLGPDLRTYYPLETELNDSLEQIGAQLFQGTVAIYGGENITRAEGMLLNIENLNLKGYIYFDSFPNEDFRSGEEQFMLSVLSPAINYFDSLKIREILKNMSSTIKTQKKWSIRSFYKKILKVLTSNELEDL